MEMQYLCLGVFNMEIKYWILVGVLSATIWLIKWGFTSIMGKFNELIDASNKTNVMLAKHAEQLNNGDERMTGISTRVRVLENDVKSIQITCASKCK